jgi:hypothetical protein
MSKKFILVNGKEIQVDEDSLPLLKEKFGNTILNSVLDKLVGGEQNKSISINFGTVIEYTRNKSDYIGKVTGFNKHTNKFIVSIATSQNKAGGYSFSMNDSVEISKEQIKRKLN